MSWSSPWSPESHVRRHVVVSELCVEGPLSCGSYTANGPSPGTPLQRVAEGSVMDSWCWRWWIWESSSKYGRSGWDGKEFVSYAADGMPEDGRPAEGRPADGRPAGGEASRWGGQRVGRPADGEACRWGLPAPPFGFFLHYILPQGR